MNRQPRIQIDRERIAEFCRKWRIIEFALFGSVLREDFGPESDVDVLVEFALDHPTQAQEATGYEGGESRHEFGHLNFRCFVGPSTFRRVTGSGLSKRLRCALAP